MLNVFSIKFYYHLLFVRRTRIAHVKKAVGRPLMLERIEFYPFVLFCDANLFCLFYVNLLIFVRVPHSFMRPFPPAVRAP